MSRTLGMPRRPKIPDDVLAEVLLDCRRRCCVCFGLDGDPGIKHGQVAHLDHDRTNNRRENLAWLCLRHHDQFDSRTSQSKGLTRLEVDAFRNELHTWVKDVRPKRQTSLDGAEVVSIKRAIRPKRSRNSVIFPENSAQFFEARFRESFPGVRELTWFRDPFDIAARLKRLLRTPLVFTRNDNGFESSKSPIWWWGRGNCQIEHFKFLPDGRALMDVDELKITKIAAANEGAYYHCFLYLETAADVPTGVYTPDQSGTRKYEEFGVWKSHFVSRAEYDDGAAIVNGKHVRLGREAQLRCRFLKPHNLVIAAQNSAINNGEFDETLEEYLDTALQSEKAIDQLAATIRRLPKPKW